VLCLGLICMIESIICIGRDSLPENASLRMKPTKLISSSGQEDRRLDAIAKESLERMARALNGPLAIKTATDSRDESLVQWRCDFLQRIGSAFSVVFM
jgi:hypothetical protein